jgi:hypothetical protein
MALIFFLLVSPTSSTTPLRTAPKVFRLTSHLESWCGQNCAISLRSLARSKKVLPGQPTQAKRRSE